MCVHRVGSGHYTAYGSHESRWYHFNDSTVTLTNEDTVRKAKAYILFYVERAEQVASDKPATNPPAVDAKAADCVAQDAPAGDGVATNIVLTDVASSHNNSLDVEATDKAILENEGEVVAALCDADVASVQGTTEKHTSDKAGTEEASQAIQAVAK